MQHINKVILNPLFMTAFMGGMAFAAAAVVVHWRARTTARRGRPARIADMAAVREAFEDKWVRWNAIRTVANVASFGCFAWALVLYGKAAG